MPADRNIHPFPSAVSKDKVVAESIKFFEHLFVSNPRRDFRVRFRMEPLGVEMSAVYTLGCAVWKPMPRKRATSQTMLHIVPGACIWLPQHIDFDQLALNLYQILLAKPVGGKSGMPLIRAGWYRG